MNITVKTICLTLALLCIAAEVVLYLHNWVIVLRDPCSVWYEGHVLWSSLRLANGENIYAASRLLSAPWWMTHYPPLFILAAVPLIKIFGPKLCVLQLISMISTSFSALMLYRICRRSGCGVDNAIIAVVLFFSMIPIFVSSFVARVDMFATSLCLWALERFVNNWELGKVNSSGLKALWSSIFLLVLAAMAKQPSIIFGLSIVIFLFWNGCYRTALGFFVIWAGAISLISLIIQCITGGYFNHISHGGWLWGLDSIVVNIPGLAPDWTKIVIGALVILTALAVKRQIIGIERLAYVLFFGSAFASFYLMGLPGNSINQVISLYLVFSWWVSLRLRYLTPWIGSLTLVIVLLSLGNVQAMGEFMNRLYPVACNSEKLLKKLKLEGKLIFCEDPVFAVRTKSIPVIVDCAAFVNAWRRQPEQMIPLVNAIRQKEFACVIINSMDSRGGGGKIHWPPSVVAAIRMNYQLVGQSAGQCYIQDVYVPKGRYGAL